MLPEKKSKTNEGKDKAASFTWAEKEIELFFVVYNELAHLLGCKIPSL